ncbi:MAG: BrnT family toxin [Clostridiales Family XIII bacterium]|jgi:uncharacterized DUF497 family protein|nr:BrnT family toxin [Clostridiales Family XIII bacterium]
MIDYELLFNYNLINLAYRFEWDDKKNITNIKKHGISFKTAATVFCDSQSLLAIDPKHSDDEDRFVMLGMDLSQKILLVCHCCRNNGNTIRIISARKATKGEETQYWAKYE